MQFPGQAPVTGVLYTTTMSRPDSALALALLYGLQGKREARMGAISLEKAGLRTASYCDAVGRFYAGPGPVANSNRVLPIGLAAEGPLSPDPPMVLAALARRNDKGTPAYIHTTDTLSDTAEPCALLRNALTAQADHHAVLIVSGPATHVARMLGLGGIAELIAAKVRTLILCECGPATDRDALAKILSSWTSPLVLCPRSVAEAVLYPAASIERDFSWTPAHPVVDAYRAFRPMPYDAPTLDLAAMLYAIRPDTGMLTLSEPGTIAAQPDGTLAFTLAPNGPHRSLAVDPARKEELLKLYIEVASAKPVPRPTGRPRPAAVEQKQAAPAVKESALPKETAPKSAPLEKVPVEP